MSSGSHGRKIRAGWRFMAGKESSGNPVASAMLRILLAVGPALNLFTPEQTTGVYSYTCERDFSSHCGCCQRSAGLGKTTLAHKIAQLVGCPAICRDEIKEGMAHNTTGCAPGPGDEVTARTNPTSFAVLELLLRAGVTTVAEAAFQDRVWRPGLEPLRHPARIRIGTDVGRGTTAERAEDDGRGAELRLRYGAGDENRTRTISLGS